MCIEASSNYRLMKCNPYTDAYVRLIYTDAPDRRFLRNFSIYVPDHMASHPRRQLTSNIKMFNTKSVITFLISGLITCGPSGVLYNAKEYPSFPQKHDFSIVYLNKKEANQLLTTSWKFLIKYCMQFYSLFHMTQNNVGKYYTPSPFYNLHVPTCSVW